MLTPSPSSSTVIEPEPQTPRRSGNPVLIARIVLFQRAERAGITFQPLADRHHRLHAASLILATRRNGFSDRLQPCRCLHVIARYAPDLDGGRSARAGDQHRELHLEPAVTLRRDHSTLFGKSRRPEPFSSTEIERRPVGASANGSRIFSCENADPADMPTEMPRATAANGYRRAPRFNCLFGIPLRPRSARIQALSKIPRKRFELTRPGSQTNRLQN